MSTPTPPYGDVARVESLAGVDTATALGLLDTACWIIDTFVWPATIPDPVPLPVDTAATLLAVRLNFAATGGAQVVAESMGSYSYRVNVSEAAHELASNLPADLAALLAPWAPSRSSVGTITTPSSDAPAWPVDWWQRDYEHPDPLLNRAPTDAA